MVIVVVVAVEAPGWLLLSPEAVSAVASEDDVSLDHVGSERKCNCH